jgi:hypothetical protein
VFDLERRIYSVDRMRLNPSGVPLRGVAYLACAVVGSIFAARLPVVGAALGVLPWFVRDVLAPAALAAALTVLRVDGRAFHHAARSLVVYLAAPRRTIALGRPSPAGRRWRPADLLLLPDGSDPHARSFRYTGPGAVLVMVAHRSEAGSRGAGLAGRSRTGARLTAKPGARRLARGRVVGVDGGTSLRVAADRNGGPRTGLPAGTHRDGEEP